MRPVQREKRNQVITRNVLQKGENELLLGLYFEQQK